METFVNREAELKLIEDAIDVLLDNKSLLRTPIIDFHGVRGIGKTTILKEVEQRCNGRPQLQCIWVNANQSMIGFSHEIISQVKKYQGELSFQDEDGDWLSQSVDATKSLLRQGPVVMLLDSVDAADAEQLRWIEELLRNLIDDNGLFVVLASKRALSFQQERSVARKLTYHPLKPLDRRSCDIYLNMLRKPVESEVRDLIFEWTRGFPLAMSIMTEAIETGLDPREADDQKELLALLTKRVINESVLANVKMEVKRTEYQVALQLLSVPRRFNLVIMQDLIEQFAPELRRENSLAYFSLPKDIKQATDVLEWDLVRAGYAVDSPVRNIFLLKLRIEEPEMYYTIHKFLAEKNQHLAREVSGFDRMRYLREYLYHSARVEEAPNLVQQLTEAVQHITKEPLESFSQFYEEFLQDKELEEALGTHKAFVRSMLHRHWVEINRQLAARSSGPEHMHFLREFFSHMMQDPLPVDLSSELKQQVEQVIQKETPEMTLQLYEELAHDDRFIAALGDDFDRFEQRIRKNFQQKDR